MENTDWFTLPDGHKLYERTWEAPSPRAHLLILHGYSDKSDSYNDFASALTASFPVRITAFDRRGWGKSVHKSSHKGLTGPATQSLDEVNRYIHHLRSKYSTENIPLYLLGHSMGGQESLYYILQQSLPPSDIPDQRPHISGLILDAPYVGLDPEVHVPQLQVFFGKLLCPLLPWFQVKNEIDPTAISRDPVVRENFATDPLCHKTGTLQGFIAMFNREDALTALSDKSKPVPDGLKTSLSIPVFWAHGTGDKVTSFTISKNLCERLEIENKEFKAYDGWYHSLHLEPDGMKEQFANDVGEWIMRSTENMTFTSIPILDYSLSLSPTTKPTFLSDLRDAIVNVGFFYLKNTGISPHVQSRFVDISTAVFDIPLERKLEIEMVNSKHFLGYSRLGAEITAQKMDYREQFDFATELPPPGPDEPLYRNIRGPNQWPDESAIPGFRTAIEAYLSEIRPLAESFEILFAEALDLPSNALHRFFDVPQQHKLKLIKYPPPPPESDTTVQGVGAHKDSEFLTLLLQGTPHTGLEVQNKAGEWIPAPPIEGTLVVNIGRAFEALTGGVCTATTHRVSLSREHYVDEEGKSRGARFSFPVFLGMGLDLSGESVEDLGIPGHIKATVKEDKVRTDAQGTFNSMFKGRFGEGTLVHRVLSHQDVGRRWYPELLSWALREEELKGTKQ